MLNVFFNEEISEAEKKIISGLKIPSAILMENAGSGTAEYLIRNFVKYPSNEIVIITGKGNNAGDGFAAARQLSSKGVKVKVLMLSREKEIKGDALLNFSILKRISDDNLKIAYCGDLKDLKKEINKDNEIVVDAIFGTGFKGVPDKKYELIFKYINSLKNKSIISLDCPSGFYSYKQNTVCIKASATLFMGVRKFQCLFYGGREATGKSELVNIGIGNNEFTKFNTRKIFEIEKEDVRNTLPVRKINSNKYSNGKVLILAGSSGLTGAAYLCSMSAFRTGAGAVVTGIPESLNDIMEKKLTEVMTMPLEETDRKTLSLKSYGNIKNKLKWADTVLIGPGLSKDEETLELIRKIVKENDCNYVIDADAISAFRNNLKLFHNRKIILTPHTGEFAALIGNNSDAVRNDFYKLSLNFARENKIILVLKNSPTIITDGNIFYINSTGRENLATAGTGDVLSGIISGILSQSGNFLNSSVAGVYMHGLCGDNLYEKKGSDSTLAGDLIGEISEVKSFIRGVEN